MLPTADTYDALTSRFRWRIPERYNIGVDACDRWAAREPERLALLFVGADGAATEYTYGALRAWSNRLANLMRQLGLERGDRVAVLLPQAPETAVAHLATYKLGAIAVPLFALFGPEALRYRLANSGAKLVVTNGDGAAKLAGIRAGLPELREVLCIDEGVQGCTSSTPPAPPGSRRARSTRIACCWGTYRASR
jgi:acetyl-CoA synthetase